MNAQNELRTGNGLLVISVDEKSVDEWKKLSKKHGDTETYTVRTPRGFDHYYKYDTSQYGGVLSVELGNGIRYQADGGVVAPTGTIGVEMANYLPIAECPEGLLFEAEVKTIGALVVNEGKTKIKGVQIDADKSTYENALATLSSVKRSRADVYETWIEVGRLLFGVFGGSQTGYAMWDMWSRSSSKYVAGTCLTKWHSEDVFYNGTPGEAYQKLAEIARIDSEGAWVKPAPKDPIPADYIEAYHSMGYFFKTNEMNDRVYVNGNLLSDGIEALIMTKLGNNGYKGAAVFRRAFLAEGEENKFHPLKDCLNGFEWDGRDHIGELASYVKDKDGVFGLLLRKWLIGAVSKVLAPSAKEQNPMLVLAGGQGLGKSVFVNRLGSPFPEFYIASPIYPENKDFVINSCSFLVWEVEELGATIRKSDMEQLKAFLSRAYASFRAPYGKNEISKPTTASYIGTINLDGNGFLNDPTGDRRYRVCQLTSIDWAYEQVDMTQVWAQAVAAFRNGETYLLDVEQNRKMREINDRYTIEDPLADYIFNYFDVSVDETEWITPTSKILDVLKSEGKISSSVDRQAQMRVSTILSKLGCETGRKRVNGRNLRCWIGVRLNEKYEKIYGETIGYVYENSRKIT